MRLELEPRPLPSGLWRVLAPVLAVALTALAGLVSFSILGVEPGRALWAFFLAPLTSLWGVSELLVKAAPLALIALGLAPGFRAGVWNIGAEGQLTIGAVAGAGVLLALWPSDAPWVLPTALLAGILGGAAWAWIPAVLRIRRGASEILVSLMLAYVAQLLLSTLVYGPWRDPEGFNFPQTRLFQAGLPVLVEGTRLHPGVLLAPLLAVLAWFLSGRTLLGLALSVTGRAPAAAAHAGFDRPRIVRGCLLVAGALAGLAGILEATGPIGQLVPTLTPGYGFTAIIVAFLGRLHPLGILPAALVVALAYLGGETAQIEAGLPQAVTGLFQGLLLFFLLGSEVLVCYRIRWRHPAEAGVP
ncbi:MAG: ABC transporter permease [Geminicoccaceae bacterium]|nr:ABC transporter permease [Geminicoccaceae bacterium]